MYFNLDMIQNCPYKILESMFEYACSISMQIIVSD